MGTEVAVAMGTEGAVAMGAEGAVAMGAEGAEECRWQLAGCHGWPVLARRCGLAWPPPRSCAWGMAAPACLR